MIFLETVSRVAKAKRECYNDPVVYRRRMCMLKVVELKPTRRNIRAFVRLPFEIYRGDPFWVPPLLADQMQLLSGKRIGPLANGVHKFFMAYDGERPVARVLAGIDYKLMERTQVKEGYIALFESYNQFEYAKAVLDAAADFLRGEGMEAMVGPNSPSFDDFHKGMLVRGFDDPPTLYNAYNRPYLVELFEKYGFTKHCDHYAFKAAIDEVHVDRYEALLERAQNRFGFHVKQLDFAGDIRAQARDVARCVSEAFPPHWKLPPPSAEDIYCEFRRMRFFLEEQYGFLAYAGDRPVGFTLSLPDYNQLFKRMRGRLTPAGLWILLTQRKKIDQLRAVMQFVVPDYQNKAVNGVMYYRTFENARRANIRVIEGSTIDEHNLQSVVSMEKAGGKLYRIYRQYTCPLK